MTPIDLSTITLKVGRHPTRDDGLCLLEAVAWLAGEPHSDHPACASPVLAAFGRSWNDSLRTDEERTRLLAPFAPRLVGTAATPDIEERRAYLALDWLIRVHTPAWLRLVPALADHADALTALPPITNLDTATRAGDQVRTARAAAEGAARAAAWAAAEGAARAAAWAAAWDAARAAAEDAAEDAAWDAAWAAAGAAAGDAARAAAEDAAWAAAGAAAEDAARAAARAAAEDAARAAAEAAAEDAAWAAAEDAAWDAAWAAAGAAAGAALEPTVVELQASAADLYTRMIEVTA